MEEEWVGCGDTYTCRRLYVALREKHSATSGTLLEKKLVTRPVSSCESEQQGKLSEYEISGRGFMYQWRPVRGEIQRLDQSLTSPGQIEEFFANERVIARGEHDGDLFRFEIAVVGRRRRIARIAEKTEENAEDRVEPGMNLPDFADKIAGTLRKVQVDIDGYTVYPTIDLGEVGITDDDFIFASASVPNEEEIAERAHKATTVDGIDVPQVQEGSEILPEGEGKIPTFRSGPMLVLSDVPFARVPGVAARIQKPVAVMEVCGANAMIADTPLTVDAEIGGRPNFVIVLSTDGDKHGSEGNPVLAIRQNSGISSWKWIDTLTDLKHVDANKVASEFSRVELGSGARARRIMEDFPDIDEGELIDTLNAPADQAVERFTQVLGLPHSVREVLAGERAAEDIPDVTVFQPQSFAQRFQSSMAYEVSGYGSTNPNFWKIYRKLLFSNPRLMEVVSTVQAGIGVAGIVAGTRLWNRRLGKLLVFGGGALALNGSTRILTAQWIKAAMRAEGLNPDALSAFSALEVLSAYTAHTAHTAHSPQLPGSFTTTNVGATATSVANGTTLRTNPVAGSAHRGTGPADSIVTPATHTARKNAPTPELPPSTSAAQ